LVHFQQEKIAGGGHIRRKNIGTGLRNWIFVVEKVLKEKINPKKVLKKGKKRL